VREQFLITGKLKRYLTLFLSLPSWSRDAGGSWSMRAEPKRSWWWTTRKW
jgi:hypothetical protein